MIHGGNTAGRREASVAPAHRCCTRASGNPRASPGMAPEAALQGSAGAGLHPGLRTEPIELVLRKGYHADIDSYSAFVENDRATRTGFAGYMRERGFTRIFCAGLALDYCVRYSAEDARELGFEAVVVTDACRGPRG